ncbi:phytoene/squalene synthase family protein [Paenibacillus silviterrae]|uniref:phytoene/squalene synthase family protein n=1 Tax=Paenibacillus silviterrae TaxID=3242194 RepID=UPI00254343EE|nr:phytoene/squalene synthase family protein [Paenibacillus chinjuensis]
MKSTLTDAYAVCEEVVKKHSSSFYRAFSVLPVDKRNAVWAIYAFCRTVDNIVDGQPGQAVPLLNEFEISFDRMLSGRPEPHPHWLALRDVFDRYPMDAAPFWDMVLGQRLDLKKFRYRTQAELEHYCYLVAGTVGLMLLPVLSPVHSDDMKRKAVKLGVAMQITNILRDVAEDYERGRVYLPEDVMSRYGYSEQDIAAGSSARGWAPLFRHLAEWAEECYNEGLSAQLHYPRDSRLALASAALIYRQILVESRLRHGDVFSSRVRVSNMKKVTLMISLLAKRNTWSKSSIELETQGRFTC